MIKEMTLTFLNEQEGALDVHVRMAHGLLTYRIRSTFSDDEDIVTLDPADSETFINRLELLNIEGWDNLYIGPGYDEPDAEMWSLSYETEWDSREIRGMDGYPSNWDSFMDMMDDLVVEIDFVNPDRIEHFEMNYTRFVPIEGEEDKRYEEIFTADRAMGVVMYQKLMDPGCTTSFQIDNKAIVRRFLDFLTEDLPVLYDGNLDEAERTVEIITERRDGLRDVVAMPYTRTALPEAWPEVIRLIHHLFEFMGPFGDLINHFAYDMGRRPGEYIYPSVSFDGESTYWYRTEDESIEAGMYVIVPVGPENIPALGRVLDISYFLPENVPYPLDETKIIMRPALPEEIPDDDA